MVDHGGSPNHVRIAHDQGGDLGELVDIPGETGVEPHQVHKTVESELVCRSLGQLNVFNAQFIHLNRPFLSGMAGPLQ